MGSGRLSGRLPKKLAGYYDIKYNDRKQYALLKGYNKAVEEGDISPLVGFDQYKTVADEVEKKLIGKEIAGIKMESYTTHFIDRIIGQTADDAKGKRKGVAVDTILATIKEDYKVIEQAKTIKNGVIDERKKIICKECHFVISETDRRFVQVNPKNLKQER